MENPEINEELSAFNTSDTERQQMIHQKMDELVDLIAQSDLPHDTLQELRIKFSTAVRDASSTTALQPYVRNGRRRGADEEDPELDQLFAISQPDRRKHRKHTVYSVIARVLRILIAILLILLGFGMIIMPAPPYFEMFTLFYLSPNDGVTIMDVISLIVAFVGVYLLITSVAKLKK